MQTRDKREQHWQGTLEAAAALRQRPGSEPGAAPEPGEIYLCRRTADFPVEWLVVEDATDRLRLVPVDDYPLVGSRDVELNARAVGGVAVARCGHGTWVEAHLLDAELRTDTIDTEDLEKTRDKLRAVAADALEPVLLEQVVDGDPEYQRWCEGTLASAATALAAVDIPARPIWLEGLRRHWKPIVALAALLGLALSMGRVIAHLDSQLATAKERIAELERQSPEQESLLAEQARKLEASEAEANRLSELLGTAEGALVSARDEAATMAELLASAERKLSRALDAGVVARVKKLSFGRKERFTRGGSPSQGRAESVDRSSVDRLFFELEVVDPEPYLTYRVRLQPRSGREVMVDALHRQGSIVSFSLPSGLLEVDDFQILIDGMEGGEAHELKERYRLIVE